MMKRITALVMIVCLLCCAAAMARGAYLGYLTVVNCEEWVTLREKPSTGAKSVCRVPLDAEVESFYYNSEFTECFYDGWHGYILSSYLYDENASSGEGDEYYLGRMTVANCKEFVTLRSEPDTKSAAVTRVPLGETVEAYNYSDTFTLCVYNDLIGYILSDYLLPEAELSEGMYLE